MELETKFFIFALVLLLVGVLVTVILKIYKTDQSIQTRPQPVPVPPVQGNPPVAPPTQNNVQVNTATGFRWFDACINFVKLHWAITALFGLGAIWLLSWVFTCTAPSIASNISSTAQTTGYAVVDSWSENKKAHDKKTGNYIPDEISGDITKTISGKKILYNFTITKDSKTVEFEVPIYSGYNFFLPTTITASNGELTEELIPKDSSAPELKPGKWRLSSQKYFNKHPTEQQVSGWIEFTTK